MILKNAIKLLMGKESLVLTHFDIFRLQMNSVESYRFGDSLLDVGFRQEDMVDRQVSNDEKFH